MSVSVYKEVTAVSNKELSGWLYFESGKRVRVKKSILEKVQIGDAVTVFCCKNFNGDTKPLPVLVVKKDGTILMKKIGEEGTNILDLAVSK